MMMERAKTAPAPEPQTHDVSKSKEQPSGSAPAATASAEERVQDLERRLKDLGGESGASAASVPAAAAPAAAPAKQQQTGKNNPLLKRIQAAQERARLAEQKEKEEKAAAAAAIERKKKEEEESRLRAAEEERIAKAQSALRSVAGRALEDKQKEILAQLEGKAPPTEAAATPGVPIMKTLDPPPPSFDSMKFPPPREQANVMMPGSEEMVGHGMNSRKLTEHPPPPQQQAAPPSFDFVETQLTAAENVPPPPPAPTAPSISPSAPPVVLEGDHLQGVMPVAPPMMPTEQQQPPPPSFEAFEQQQAPPTETAPTEAMDDEGVFAYDEEGNPLSPEQKQALLDEQRRLYESIMQEKAANDAAIAQANADAFDMRSSNAAAAAMDGGGSHAAHTQAMDAVGRNVEPSDAATEGPAEGDQPGDARRDSRRMVKIGNNQMVALHGQDRTKRAIKEGTAILVQCINCQNWMQVTDTATLMFCPVCQVVSPVIQQNEVMTKEEAIQLTMDRKLAEKLQAEAYADDDERKEGGEAKPAAEQGFFGRLFGAAEEAPSPSASLTASGTRPHSDTWWDKISSIVSYGVADDGPRERGDMGVSLPPGAPPSAQYPAQRRGSPTSAASGSPARREETRGLLAPVVDGNEESLPSARVAESKPLFSCIADSMSSAAQALYSTGEGDGEGNVHGVDASSLLMTNAGRGVGDGAGSYEQLPDRE